MNSIGAQKLIYKNDVYHVLYNKCLDGIYGLILDTGWTTKFYGTIKEANVEVINYIKNYEIIDKQSVNENLWKTFDLFRINDKPIIIGE